MLRLNTQVTKIAVREDGSGVDVTTHAGDTYSAKHCICTLPLGVLKSGAVRFEPALSDAKRMAIEKMGMGQENKVILVYRPEDVFWPNDHGYFNCTDQRFRFANLHFFGKTGVLVAHICPPFAGDMQDMDDAEVVDEVLQCLKGMFPLPEENAGESECEGGVEDMDVDRIDEGGRGREGAEAVTAADARPPAMQEARPVATRVTRWHTDPFSSGSYSYMAVGSRVADRVELSRPEHGGTLLFAGEATSIADHQCVTGAFKSGRRAARAALKLLLGSVG